MKRFFIIIFVFCFWITLGLHSAQAEDASLGEVLVTGTQDEAALGSASTASHDSISFTQVITSKDLKGRKTSLPEMIQQSSGVQTKHLGGLDDFATVSIRGSTSEQVSIYLDGILLNQGSGGSVNLATIPTNQIERIEIYKGAAPAAFDSSSMGGVVNIVTKKSGKKRETRLTQSYGSFKTYEGSLSQSQGWDRFSYQASYNFQRSSGDFDYVDNNGTPFNSADDRVTSRKNNQFMRHNLATHLEYFLNSEKNFSLGFHNNFFHESRGIPGLATLTSDTAHLTSFRDGASLDLSKKNIFPHFLKTDLQLAPFFQYVTDNFSDPNGEIGLGIQNNQNKTFQYGTSLGTHTLWGNHQRLNTYTGYRGEDFLPFDSTQSPPEGPKSRRDTFQLSFEDEIFLLGEKIVLNPSLRTEQIFNHFASSGSSSLHPISGKIGVKYTPIHFLSFRSNFSRSYRLPSFTELFGDRGTFVGNPTLSPESTFNWDLGFLAQWKPVHLELSYYLNHVNDLIQLLQTSQYTIQAQNLSKARIQGIEFLVSSPLGSHLDLTGNYTFQIARNTSGLPGLDGKLLPGRPQHQFNGKVTVHNTWGKIFSEMNLLDGNYLDTQNILRVNRRVLLASGASVHFLKKMTASFEAKNLLNDLVSDVVGFPLPGRSYYGKLEIEI